MGHSLKHSLCFYVLSVTPSVGLEIHTETLQLSLLLKGCSSALKFKLSPVGRHALIIFHSEKWILELRTLKIHVTGATLLKRGPHQRKMNLMSNTIKSNASLCGMFVDR